MQDNRSRTMVWPNGNHGDGSGDIWWLADLHTKARNWSWRVGHHYLAGLVLPPILLCVLTHGSGVCSFTTCISLYCFGHKSLIQTSISKKQVSLSFLIQNTCRFRVCQKCTTTFHQVVKVPIGNDWSQYHPMIRNRWSPENDRMIQ